MEWILAEGSIVHHGRQVAIGGGDHPPAFGLMEFADMAQVQTVDEAMIARTRDWLLRQQNADGSWQGDQSEFFTFQTSLVRNTAFVVWALASAGYTGSSCPPWGYPPRRPNLGPPDRLPLNRGTAGGGSTDGTSTRAGWSRLPA